MQTELTEKLDRIKDLAPKSGPFHLGHTVCRLLIAIVGFVVYLSIGAAIFSAIETPGDLETISNLRQFRKAFLEEHPCITGEKFTHFVLLLNFLCPKP